MSEQMSETADFGRTRELAYERAARLYADALKVGGTALESLGSARWRLNPTPQGFHANVLAIAEFLVAADSVPPGLCWHDSGIMWPTGTRPRCELRTGHAGAHECDRGSMGGSAVWTDTESEDA